jgi:hypothetical protein
MSSWRDSASQQAQDDLDSLVNACLPFAEEMLQRRGEFFPFGASISMAGETSMLGGDPGQGEHPQSGEVISTLVDGLRRQRGALRAAAVAADVRTPNGDAIRVELEHAEGQAIAVLLPYKKKRFGRGFEFLPLQAGLGQSQIWTDA